MIRYLAIRTIAVILGLSSLIVALLVFVVDLVASLSNVDPTNDYAIVGLIAFLIISGVGTMAAPIFIFTKYVKKFFIPSCIILGIGYVIGYFISKDAINTVFELLLITMAFLYFGLAYLVYVFLSKESISGEIK